MATKQSFDGKILIIPGVYSNIKSGLKNVPQALAYGDTLIIDTGSGATWGGGAGINGTITEGRDSIYEFDNIEDFRSFAEGGIWWLLGQPLFRPNGVGSTGVSKLLYIKAAQTVPAIMTFNPQGGDASDSVGGGGTLVIQVRSEGIIGNGVLGAQNGTDLSKGYSWKLVRGVRDVTKFKMQFFRGTYRDLDQNNLPNDGILENDTKSELIVESKEFKYCYQLVNWMKTSFNFNKFFRFDEDSSTFDPTGGEVDDGDFVTFGYGLVHQLATGGTENYRTQDLTDVLTIIKDLPIDFIFADDWGTDAFSTNNQSLHTFIKDESKFKPQLYIASGSLKADLAASLQDAADYDSQYVTIVHGGAKKASRTAGTGFRNYDSYYKAAILLGREAGIEPQVPLTFKSVEIEGETHSLVELEKVKCLEGGVLITAVAEGGRFECVKGINSKQDNELLLNPDGTTHSKQLFRIVHQINKEIIITAKRDLLNNPAGVNRNSLSALDVLQWTKNFLQKKVASPTADNLILGFQNVSVSRTGDAYRINYEITANTEISFLLFTGFMVDIN